MRPVQRRGQERLLSGDLDFFEVGGRLVESFLYVIRELNDQVHQLEAVIEGIAAELKETQLLMTIPGVSFYSGLLIYAEIGGVDRFDRAAELVSYAGLNPVVRESGDSRKEGGISKQGSRALRWMLVQCATVAVTRANDPYLGRFYARLRRRKNQLVAVVATARKLLVSIFHMLDREEVYDPPGVTA